MARGCSRLMFGKPVIHTVLILDQLVLGSISGSSDVFQIAEEVTFTGRMPRQKEVSIRVETALSSQSSVGWDSTIPVSRGDPLPLWSPPLDLCPSTVVAVTSWMLLHLPIASMTIASTLCSPAPVSQLPRTESLWSNSERGFWSHHLETCTICTTHIYKKKKMWMASLLQKGVLAHTVNLTILTSWQALATQKENQPWAICTADVNVFWTQVLGMYF